MCVYIYICMYIYIYIYIYKIILFKLQKNCKAERLGWRSS